MKKVIIRKTEEIENWRRNINSEINFIPTMGNLHNGHIKLISTAKNDNSNVNLVSIFINPLQFDNKLDLENYPKTIDNDIKISFSNGADAIFIPSNEDIYPPNNKNIKFLKAPKELSSALCGLNRIGHFDGVCTVVYRLLNLIKPKNLYLGEKDWQQLLILKNLVLKEKLNVAIKSIPTQRDFDGIPLSSRNVHLSKNERKLIRFFSSELLEAKKKFQLDVWYVKNQTFWLDIKIMCLTPWIVIKRDGINAGRRRFLRTVTVTGGGFLVGFSSMASFSATVAKGSDVNFSPFIRISPDNTVTAIIKHLDKGQGVTTGLTSVVAEELGASWEQMRWEFAPADATRYGNLAWGGKSQGTGGSNSMRNSWEQLRTTAAATREVLLEAGSIYLKVKKSSLRTEEGSVIDKDGRNVTFGTLVDLASSLEPPQIPPLKRFDQFKKIGLNVDKRLPRIDSREKTTGAAQYTIDFRAQGLLAAVIEHPPLFGARAKDVNRTEVEKINEVEGVFVLTSGAVAIVASDHWSAIKARDALKVEWDDSGAEKRGNAEFLADYRARNEKPGAIASSRGDLSILDSSNEVVETEFILPFLAHAPMEPLNAVARFHDGRLDVWSGCQSQTRDQSAVANGDHAAGAR